ncbi:MAG: class I SAM-dependent methyltransferase [Candidatus Cyclobacteriaceae bacterium M3_2C_046]
MDHHQLNQLLGNVDLYLLDQILKGRFHPSMKILDAGSGEGRNLIYFLQQKYDVFAIDPNPSAIRMLGILARQYQPDINPNQFQVQQIENMTFPDQFFDAVVCNAVLHFAKNPDHFEQIFQQLWRVLKHGGILFIRMASDLAIDSKLLKDLDNGWSDLPDGSSRFLLKKGLLQHIEATYHPEFLEPIKTVNVNNKRCMTNLVFKKPSL